METKGYNIKIRSIELVSKSLNLTPEILSEPLLEYGFNFNVDVKVGPPEKIAIASTSVAILDKSGQSLSNITTLCVFDFPEFEKAFPLNEDNRYDMDLELEVFLKSISIATTRGMLYTELRGTPLHGAILPLINLRPLIIADREKQDKARGKKD